MTLVGVIWRCLSALCALGRRAGSGYVSGVLFEFCARYWRPEARKDGGGLLALCALRSPFLRMRLWQCFQRSRSVRAGAGQERSRDGWRALSGAGVPHWRSVGAFGAVGLACFVGCRRVPLALCGCFWCRVLACSADLICYHIPIARLLRSSSELPSDRLYEAIECHPQPFVHSISVLSVPTGSTFWQLPPPGCVSPLVNSQSSGGT